MKVTCGLGRFTLEPENDADRALLYIYKDKKISVEFDMIDEIIEGKCVEMICMYVNFEDTDMR